MTAKLQRGGIMTLLEAKNLKSGDYIHSLDRKNADNTPMRARVTSVKTWKTRPDEVLVSYKRGMYEYGKINQNELTELELGYGS